MRIADTKSYQNLRCRNKQYIGPEEQSKLENLSGSTCSPAWSELPYTPFTRDVAQCELNKKT